MDAIAETEAVIGLVDGTTPIGTTFAMKDGGEYVLTANTGRRVEMEDSGDGPEWIGSRQQWNESQAGQVTEVQSPDGKITSAEDPDLPPPDAEPEPERADGAIAARLVTLVRIRDGDVEIQYEVCRGDHTDKYTMVCSEAPRPALPQALAALAPHVIEICEFPADYGQGIRVTGLRLTHKKEILGAVITAVKTLGTSDIPFVIHTPHKTEFPYSPQDDGAAQDKCLSEGAVMVISAVVEEAFAYIDGSRAVTQARLPFADNAAPASPSAGAVIGDWKPIPLSEVPGLPPIVRNVLANAEPAILTIGDLTEFQAKFGETWAQKVKGFGPSSRQKLDEAMERFWAKRKKQ
ncbi:MAG: hypothetical protein PHU85_03105 [Phycisphaerae bacterium]|nr:hypothetical protein [Phycisphaerae bacterium]